MKVRINPYTSKLLGKDITLYDTKTGELLFRNSANKIEPFPRQSQILKKLKRLLEKYNDDSDVPLKKPEADLIPLLARQGKTTTAKKTQKKNKTKKSWFSFA